MINLITSPDTIDNQQVSILLVNQPPEVIELTVAAARLLDQDINIYIGGEREDAGWYGNVIQQCDAVFKRSGFKEIHQYLKELDGRHQSTEL